MDLSVGDVVVVPLPEGEFGVCQISAVEADAIEGFALAWYSEAGDAFAELAARAGVPAELAADWFDDWRDF